MSLLSDYEPKRGRAGEHFAELRGLVDDFTQADREPVRGTFDSDSSQYVFEVPLEATNPDWSLLLGDFAYDTRASLDYLITALIRSNGEVENRMSEFPIYGFDPTDRIPWHEIDQWWESGAGGQINRKLGGTPSGTKDALKKLQPFYGVPQVNPDRHPLYALSELNNRDKHRRLNLLARQAEVTFTDAGGMPLYEGPPSRARIADSGDGDSYTASLAVGEKREGDIYLLPAYDVAINEPPALLGNLIETLEMISGYIDHEVLPVVKALI